MFCLRFVLHYDEALKPPVEAALLLLDGDKIMIENVTRLIVRPLGNMTVMSPPLIMTQGQIDEMADILRDSISAVTDDLKKQGKF